MLEIEIMRCIMMKGGQFEDEKGRLINYNGLVKKL